MIDKNIKKIIAICASAIVCIAFISGSILSCAGTTFKTGLNNEANVDVNKAGQKIQAPLNIPVIKNSEKANVKVHETVSEKTDSNASEVFRDINFAGTIPVAIISAISILANMVVAVTAICVGCKRGIGKTQVINKKTKP